MNIRKKNKKSIMIVDDHPVVRRGIAQLINSETDLSVCCEAQGGREALKKLEKMQPDLMIVDLSLKDINGVEMIKEIKRRHASIPVLVLTMHEEAFYAERAIRAGAMGYVMKHEGTEILITAIRYILSGKLFVSTELASKLISKSGSQAASGENIIECLSDRELQVFELIGKGLKTRKIAETLCLSIKTIETYRGNIKSKLGLSSANELMKQAILWSKSLEAE